MLTTPSRSGSIAGRQDVHTLRYIFRSGYNLEGSFEPGVYPTVFVSTLLQDVVDDLCGFGFRDIRVRWHFQATPNTGGSVDNMIAEFLCPFAIAVSVSDFSEGGTSQPRLVGVTTKACRIFDQCQAFKPFTPPFRYQRFYRT